MQRKALVCDDLKLSSLQCMCFLCRSWCWRVEGCSRNRKSCFASIEMNEGQGCLGEEGREQTPLLGAWCFLSVLGSAIMTGSYNNFFRMFDRSTRRDVTLEASRESSKPRAILKPRKVCTGGKRKKDEINVDSLDFNKKILHTAWHPMENIIAVAATNNLYIFQDKIN